MIKIEFMEEEMQALKRKARILEGSKAIAKHFSRTSCNHFILATTVIKTGPLISIFFFFDVT